ncbi:phage virion morphogenesis protein [Moritella viscosa]|uniref:phage virion morphogenesis protein n=1 Tax=Moritella viscosa TaxID=80854 RepID=UPI00090EC2E6|nr:phage virion morphogenesis protein [Moritella viscosa]SGY86561.1 Prophage PSPPH06, virion morphogenesis protein [Moritella viscosa]
MLNIGITTGAALKELDLLTLDANKRRRILRGAGRKVRRDTKARLKGQKKGLSGTNWQGRSDGRKKRMLKKLGKGIQVHTTPNNAKVTFGNQRVGQIARVHQEGITLEKQASESTSSNQQNAKDLASRSLAKDLRDSGYKIRKKRGKGWKSPSLKWITENVTKGQGWLVLRILQSRTRKKRWNMALPARSFMGQNSNEQTQLKNYMLDEAFRLR